MRTNNLIISSLLAITALVACPASDGGAATESNAATLFSNQYCAYAFSCECEDYGYPDEEFCRGSVYDEVNLLIREGQRANLIFDQECFEGFLASDANGECEPPTTSFDDDDAAEECFYCEIYHGTVAEGEPCQETGYFDDCAKGTYCSDGVCIDPCATAAVGEPCTNEGGYLIECDPGASCDYETEICVALPAVGEPCDSVSCVEGAYCNLESTCEVLPKLGEICSFQCEGSLVCDVGLCAVPPVEGEPCPTGQCAENLYCDTETDDWACRSYADVGEPCDDDFDCTSVSCDDGVCTAQEPWVCG